MKLSLPFKPPPRRTIKLVAIDVDGTMTDGKVYCSASGEEMLAFDRRDGYGIRRLRESGVLIIVVSGEDSLIVQKRCEKLGVPYLVTQAKKIAVNGFLQAHEILWEECAYIGDDENDLEVLEAVGFAMCPANAQQSVRQKVWNTEANGGSGAVREFCESVLARNQDLAEKAGKECGILSRS